MASKLIGTWELQSDENINEYLKKIGKFSLILGHFEK